MPNYINGTRLNESKGFVFLTSQTPQHSSRRGSSRGQLRSTKNAKTNPIVDLGPSRGAQDDRSFTTRGRLPNEAK